MEVMTLHTLALVLGHLPTFVIIWSTRGNPFIESIPRCVSVPRGEII